MWGLTEHSSGVVLALTPDARTTVSVRRVAALGVDRAAIEDRVLFDLDARALAGPALTLPPSNRGEGMRVRRG